MKHEEGWGTSDAACPVLDHTRFFSHCHVSFSDFMLHAVKGPHNKRIIQVVKDSPVCPGTGQMGTGSHGRGAVSPPPIMVLTFGAKCQHTRCSVGCRPDLEGEKNVIFKARKGKL